MAELKLEFKLNSGRYLGVNPNLYRDEFIQIFKLAIHG